MATKVCQKMNSKNAINISKPTKTDKNIFKSKIEKIKACLKKPSKKKIFESKIKEIKEILHDSIIDRVEKIEEIKKKFFMIQKIIFLKIKIKLYQLKIILMKLSHIL